MRPRLNRLCTFITLAPSYCTLYLVIYFTSCPHLIVKLIPVYHTKYKITICQFHGSAKESPIILKYPPAKNPESFAGGNFARAIYPCFRFFTTNIFAAIPSPIIPQKTGAVTTMESLEMPEIM